MIPPALGRFGRLATTTLLTFSLFFGLGGLSACAEKTTPPTSGTTVSVQQLPPEAQKTLTLIHQGGPFPHKRDGIAFGNREKQLPAKPRGYYREYTVPTPGARDRGARRIVCGGDKPSAPDLCYYTADHYRSFQRVHHETAQP